MDVDRWMASGCQGHSSKSPVPTTLPSESNSQSDGLGGKLTVSDFISQRAAVEPGAELQSNKERDGVAKGGGAGAWVCARVYTFIDTYVK